MDFDVVRINDDYIQQLDSLAENALNDGYRIVRKTIDQWNDNTNKFTDSKEALFGVKVDEKIVAIGGINIDPYLMDSDVGRIRHIYVHTEHRNKGIARFLLTKILDEKSSLFRVLRLSTKNEAAMQLYEEYGFKKVVEFKATHIKIIKDTIKK